LSIHERARRPLRVLSIAHAAINHATGRLRYIPLAADKDIELTLLAPERWYEGGQWLKPDPPDGGVSTILAPIRLPKVGRAGWYMHYYPNMKQVFGRFQPDVIHLWEEPWSVVAAQAVWLRDHLSPSSAIVIEVDQNIDRRLPEPFELMRRFTLRATDHLMARHADAVAVACARGYRGPHSIVEYGFNDSVFRPIPHRRIEMRARIGASGFTIGYVGRLVPQKGIDDLLAALAQCQRPVSLLVQGNGPHRPHLEQEAARLGVSGRTRFLPAAPPSEVALLMGALDVLVLPSRTTSTWREQFGRVIVEAQLCGVPVLGSSSGSIPDVIGPGGWVVPERNSAALAACLDRLADSPDEVAAVAEAGYRHACSRFTYDNVARALKHSFISGARERAMRAEVSSLQAPCPAPTRP
jgi:glycosyltransferase involved in cell wall biosynthesis